MEKNILCFGDSNTWGYVPGGNGARHSRDVRWSGRLQQLLGSDYHVVEEGLNNRTIVWEDPVRGNKSGLDYIVPCLQSHKPLDLVIVMLGSNDCKDRFSVNEFSIASSMMRFLDAIAGSHAGHNNQAPKVLLVAPTPIRREMTQSQLSLMWDMSQAAVEKSEKLGDVYKNVAKELGCDFLDAKFVCQASPIDCLHLDAAGHIALADAVSRKVKEIMARG